MASTLADRNSLAEGEMHAHAREILSPLFACSCIVANHTPTWLRIDISEKLQVRDDVRHALDRVGSAL